MSQFNHIGIEIAIKYAQFSCDQIKICVHKKVRKNLLTLYNVYTYFSIDLPNDYSYKK